MILMSTVYVHVVCDLEVKKKKEEVVVLSDDESDIECK